PHSRTTWVAVVDGDLYVPCGFPAAKRWPHEALRDGRVVVRIEGRRYQRQAVRETDPARLRRLGAEVERKYGAGNEEAAVAGEEVWFFRLDPRPSAWRGASPRSGSRASSGRGASRLVAGSVRPGKAS